MPPPVQTKPKKISPLIRNAIKSQPEELQFVKKVEPPKLAEVVHTVDESTDEDFEEVDVSTEEEDSVDVDAERQMCPGCYHCNWTGVSGDGKADCRRHYYGDVN